MDKNTKKFQEWSEKKVQINQKKTHRYFKERDIFFISIGKNIGYEIAGKGKEFLRPVIILKRFNNHSFLGVPLTSQKKSGKYFYNFCFKDNKDSVAILSQVRYFDARRLKHKMGMASPNDFKKIKESIQQMLSSGIISLNPKKEDDPEGIIIRIIPTSQPESTTSKNLAQFILDKAESQPEEVSQKLSELHQKGETVEDIIAFVQELESRKIPVNRKSPLRSSDLGGDLEGVKIFDVCGTGGTGLSRINLSTALAIRLSRSGFAIAKHGNKAASGRIGSFDLIGNMNLEISDTPEKVIANLENQNLAFVFAPAFHPSLKPLAPIRQKIGHPTIFNYLGPLLNPVQNLTAQMTGVASEEILDKLAEVAAVLGKNILFVHDKAFGLDDVSIGGETIFAKVKNGQIEKGSFVPEDFGLLRAKDFVEISGGDIEKNSQVFQQMIQGTAPTPIQNFLEINARVSSQFFSEFI